MIIPLETECWNSVSNIAIKRTAEQADFRKKKVDASDWLGTLASRRISRSLVSFHNLSGLAPSTKSWKIFTPSSNRVRSCRLRFLNSASFFGLWPELLRDGVIP